MQHAISEHLMFCQPEIKQKNQEPAIELLGARKDCALWTKIKSDIKHQQFCWHSKRPHFLQVKNATNISSSYGIGIGASKLAPSLHLWFYLANYFINWATWLLQQKNWLQKKYGRTECIEWAHLLGANEALKGNEIALRQRWSLMVVTLQKTINKLHIVYLLILMLRGHAAII